MMWWASRISLVVMLALVASCSATGGAFGGWLLAAVLIFRFRRRLTV